MSSGIYACPLEGRICVLTGVLQNFFDGSHLYSRHRRGLDALMKKMVALTASLLIFMSATAAQSEPADRGSVRWLCPYSSLDPKHVECLSEAIRELERVGCDVSRNVRSTEVESSVVSQIQSHDCVSPTPYDLKCPTGFELKKLLTTRKGRPRFQWIPENEDAGKPNHICIRGAGAVSKL